MLLSWIIAALYVLSVFGAVFFGRGAQVNAAMLAGASDAVHLALRLAGPVSLWSALQCAMERAGCTAALARLLRPVLRRIFPRAAKDPEALSGSDTASDEMCRLIVMNTASIQIIPTTVAALRASLGAAAPYAIVPAVWLTSLLSVTAGLAAARCMERRI